MTNEEDRRITIPFGFLGKGKFSAKIYMDPEEAADYPDRVYTIEKTVSL